MAPSWSQFMNRSVDKNALSKARATRVLAGLIVFNLLAWGWALLAFHDQPILLGTALLAYSFGLRHAFDADHIAAIDNVTRKLMNEGQRPVGVGLFFSLGHSTVVFVLTVIVAATTVLLTTRFDAVKELGGLIGTSVSALFLIVIALANLVVFIQIVHAFRAAQRGETVAETDIDMLLGQRGFFGRIFRRLFALISKSWHMYPLGLLFGLGFDTATEIGLLGLSAAQASQGTGILSILVFPVLFTAGMSLMDTADGIFMLRAYGWAFVRPIRKLYYNMTITFLSIVVALAIGGLEVLGLLGEKLALKGPFWEGVAAMSDNLGGIGYAIVALFVLSWLASWAVYRLKGYDRIDATFN